MFFCLLHLFSDKYDSTCIIGGGARGNFPPPGRKFLNQVNSDILQSFQHFAPPGLDPYTGAYNDRTMLQNQTSKCAAGLLEFPE